MGNDGGTIAKRQDILSLHSGIIGDKKETVNKLKDHSELYTTCAYSSLPLYSKDNPPIVGDYKGRLYIKQKILECLLDRRSNSENALDTLSHIKSLNDLLNINITWNTDGATATIMCPVSKEQQGKSSNYAYIRSCGCVLSYKLLKELSKHLGASLDKPREANCPSCDGKFHFDYDVIILNPHNDPKLEEINQTRYSYVKNHLHLTHSGKPKSKKKDDKAKKENGKSKKRKATTGETSSTKMKKI